MTPFRRLSRYAALAVVAILIVAAAGLAATQTGWFKNWLRRQAVSQAAQYLNGTLTIQRLGGSLFTGVELEGVSLTHEGQTVVSMDRLTVRYSPLTLMSKGFILDTLVLDRPTILLQRDDAGWNFSRFVKTRQNTGGSGAPPLTMESIAISDGHLIVKDRRRTVEDLTDLDTRLRFAYTKPGIQIALGEFSARAEGMNVRKLAGNLAFDRGAIEVSDFTIETGGTSAAVTVTYGGSPARTLAIDLHAERLSLPEVGRYFSPVAGIRLEPAVDIKGKGTLDALAMDVNIVSSSGNARGPLVGHFGASPSLEGTLIVQDVNMAPILNRPEWATRVTGEAGFNWTFGRRARFTFAGPAVEGWGYRAANVRAEGVYEPSLLRFDAAGAAYGATATTKAEFRFASADRPLAYTLAGSFQTLDMRRLPPNLSMPGLESQAAGRYTFEASGRDWQASGDLDDSTVEGASFASGTLVAMESRSGVLSYSATGRVAGLNPRRFAAPLDVAWLDDERLSGSVNGSFTFEGSGRTVDGLALHVTAGLIDSTLARTHVANAKVDAELGDRRLRAAFTGPFEDLPGSILSGRRELADTTLSGSADARVAIAVPETGPVVLEEIDGSALLSTSVLAGAAVDSGRVSGRFVNQIADITELMLTGPDISASAKGTLALGEAGRSDLQYDVAVTDLAPLAGRFDLPLSGSAHAIGTATGPASNLLLAGTLDANRLRYRTTLDALTANSTYTIELPDFDLERARVETDTLSTFVTIAGTNLPRVTVQARYEMKELEFDSMFEEERRSLGLGGTIVFHPDHDEIHVRAIDLTVGEAQWMLPPGRGATARYSREALTLNGFVLQRGVQQVTAEGTVAIGAGSADLANNLNVRFENVQVEDINEILLGQRPLTGLLNADAEVRGTRNDPVMTARFSVTDGSAQDVAFNAFTGKADYEGRAVEVDARLQQTPAAVLTAVGTIPIPRGPGARSRTDEFDLRVQSTPIDIALFQAATEQVSNLKGQIRGDVRVTGTIEAPKLNGLVETSNAGFTVAATSVTYEDALARLVFEDDRLLVDRFEIVDDGQDRLVAIGEIGIVRRSVGQMNLQVSASQFKILDNEFGQVEIEADLRVTGEATAPRITGELSGDGGRLDVDRLIEVLTRNPYRTETAVATAADPPAPLSVYDAATVDVRVRFPDDLVLRGRDMHASFSRIGLGDLNLTVGGDLQIRKNPTGEPDVIGTVTVIRGFYDFQGRRFEVLRDSQIRFQGTSPSDPALQVDAQRQISGVTAVVNIRGTARQPLVRLSSSPPLDEADVLSLIVFNQPINQLGEGQRINLAERAGALAVGYLASPLANSIADALDLDIFEIRTGEGGGQPSVALGQQFGSRLFVSFRQEFGSSERSELAFEYRINELLRLVSTVTQGSRQFNGMQRVDTTGVDLIYVLSY